MEEKERIYCFDFDETLTTKDTLLEIIRYKAGTWRLLWGFLLYSPILVLMKLHLYPNWKAKQLIFTHFFGGMSTRTFNLLCQDFAKERSNLLRPDMIALVGRAVEDKKKVFIVSASIDNWVRPFFATLGIGEVEVLGTKVEEKDGCLTGRFSTANCYGAEKVRRISKALSSKSDEEKPSGEAKKPALSFDRSRYHITAYGDSRGDKEMLAFADEGHLVNSHKSE